MKLSKFFSEKKGEKFQNFFRYLGPGFIVTVGFIDPGNWATNLAAGSTYGYELLWVVVLSTLILIILQYNASKLGIVSGLCIAEASNKVFSKKNNAFVIYSGLLAVVSTLVAELLGSAIALNILFNIPLVIGTIATSILIVILIFTNKYHKLESLIIAFVSIIAFAFVFELTIAPIEYSAMLTPSIPKGSVLIILGILGAVVMPHNLFLHSEFIQSRNLEPITDKTELKKHLKRSKSDTIIAMLVGMLINGAMIILAASTFFVEGKIVDDLSQAAELLKPILGSAASGVFALALLFSGIASSITAAMSGGILTSSLKNESYNSNDRHTTIGVLGVTIASILVIVFISDPFMGLIISQVVLSIQLPITIIAQLKLTNNKSLMKDFKNSTLEKILLYSCAAVVIFLNLFLLVTLVM